MVFLAFLLADEILLENLADGERVGYSLLLIRGTLGKADHVSIALGSESRKWPVRDGRFKALVALSQGKNAIKLSAAGHPDKSLTIEYAPPAGDKFVRLVYVHSVDDSTFQAPPGEPNDVLSAKKRIGLAGLLMQTATAELMRNAGLGRRTFRLDPDVTVYKDELTMEEALGMSGNQLWDRYAQKLKSLPDYRNAKFAAFMQMTRFREGKALAHTALGGGRLGLFGSGGMHTWAQNLDELVARFSDTRRVDAFGLFPDARPTFWGNYATTVGASLHEMGHTFGLPHSGDKLCVMERGFDHFNRIFMTAEAGKPVADEAIRWSVESAKKLDASPWFYR